MQVNYSFSHQHPAFQICSLVVELRPLALGRMARRTLVRYVMQVDSSIEAYTLANYRQDRVVVCRLAFGGKRGCLKANDFSL